MKRHDLQRRIHENFSEVLNDLMSDPAFLKLHIDIATPKALQTHAQKHTHFHRGFQAASFQACLELPAPGLKGPPLDSPLNRSSTSSPGIFQPCMRC